VRVATQYASTPARLTIISCKYENRGLKTAALELALICLIAIINCTNHRFSIDVFIAIATDNVSLCFALCFIFSFCYIIL